MLRIDRGLRIVTIEAPTLYWPTLGELARFAARWSILLTFGVTTCYYGASGEARDQSQVVIEARTVYDAVGRCTTMLDRGLDAGEAAAGQLAQRRSLQRWVLHLTSSGAEYVAEAEWTRDR